MDVLCIILANIFVLAFMQKLTFIHAFIHITCITPKHGAQSAHVEGSSGVKGSVCRKQTTGPVMTGVELAKASSWLRYSRSIVSMRQTTGPVMTGVELAKASSRLHYEVSFA
jgi:hypothetical protein